MTVLQEYGISRKRYAVFCIFVHKCSASYARIKGYKSNDKTNAKALMAKLP